MLRYLGVAVDTLYEELELPHEVKKNLCTEKSTSVRYAGKNALVAVTAFICPQKDAEVELLHYKDQDFMSSLAGKRDLHVLPILLCVLYLYMQSLLRE